MISIDAGSLRRAAVVRTIVVATLLLGAMPVYAATVTATKTVAGPFYPGGPIVYTVVLNNSSILTQFDNAGSEFTDILPASLILVNASASSGTATPLVGLNSVTWNGAIPGLGSVTITINATIVASTAPGTVVANTGSANFDADDNGSNESIVLTDDPALGGTADPTSFTVTSPATVTATKTVTGPFYPDRVVTYTIVLTNSGPATQFDNAGPEFVDALPAGLTGEGASATSGTMSAGGPNIVNWNGSLASSTSVTITITARIDASTAFGATVSNQGTANFDADGNGTNESIAFTDDPAVGGAANPTSFTVIRAVTLTATKSVAGPFFPGSLITYTIILTNTGPATQLDNPGPEFVDALPAGLTGEMSSATSGATVSGGPNIVTWNGSLATSTSVTITITARIDASIAVGATVSNQGTANLDADGNGTNEASLLTDDVSVGGATNPTSFTVTTPTLTATKTVTGPFYPGGVVTYTIVLTNTGSFAQLDNPGNEFVDPLPAGVGGNNAVATSGTIAPGGPNIVTWNGSLGIGNSVTITITATIPLSTAPGTVVANQATANFDGDGNGSNESSVLSDDSGVGGATDPTSFTVTSPATVTTTKTVTGAFTPGGGVIYTVVLTNSGPALQGDYTGNEFIDVLPDSLILVSASAPSGATVATVGTRTVTWNGSLASGTSVTITINATIAAATVPGTVSNQGTASFDANGDGINEATALTDDPGTGAAADPTSFTVTSPATVTGTKTVSGTFMPGGTITYTVVLTNGGPAAQGDYTGNEFIDVLPDSLALVSANASSGAAVATGGTRTVTWNGSLASGASVTITISATIASTVPGTVSNQGTASFDANGDGINEATALTDDPATGAAADPTSFTVTSPATVTGTKTVSGTFLPGGTITYTVVLTNAGPSTQGDNPGDEFADVLPAGLTLVSGSASSGTAVATVGTGTVTWNGSLSSGASVTITISATIAASTALGTVVTNQGTASFDADGNGTNEATALTDDPGTGAAADPTSFTVTSPATLAGTKTVTGTFNPGGTITYAVVLSNTGASTQGNNPGDEFTDVLPAGLTLVSGSASSGTAVATVGTGTVTWNGSLASGASVTITISATIAASTAAGTVVTNQGTASFDADGNGTNEATALTDDPGVAGAANPTSITVTAPTTDVAYTSTVVGSAATMVGGTAGNTLTITESGGLFSHNRFVAGDPGFNSEFDFDSTAAGDQTLASASGIINVNAGDGNDTIALGAGIDVRGTIDGGAGTDTIDYTAYLTAVSANLGLNTSGLGATLGADQEVPATTHAGTGTATVTNYNIVTHTFDITVDVTNLLPADVTGFHIHRAPVGVNGPIIFDFVPLGMLNPNGTGGFTFTATGLTLPAVNEAAFLGGGTYVNIHTAAFPGGAIRGQLFSNANVVVATGVATGTASVANMENVTGGGVDDSLVGSSAVNIINGGAGADWIVGGPGNDTLAGGAGADVLVWSNGDGTDVDEGGTENDTVQVNGNTTGADVFVVAANGTRLAFNRTNVGLFALDIGTAETLIVNGIGGADTFTINDLAGVASLTAVNLNGFDGTDTFNVRTFASIKATVAGGTGADTLFYNAESRAVSGDTTPPDGAVDSPGVQSVPFTHTETINVINSQPIVAISDTVVSEDVTPTNAVFSVSLSNPSLLTVTVNFATANGTATSPGDYAAQTGTVVFVPGDLVKTIVVPIALDGHVEPAETFVVNLTGAVNAVVGDAQGQATINDNDVVSAPSNDFDGDGKADLVVFRPSSGTWYTLSSSSGFTSGAATPFGQNGDLPVPGDYDRDGRFDLAFYRPSTGTWNIQHSSTSAVVSYVFGLGTDIPVPADYDGDQQTDPAVYRPSTGVWSVLTSGSGYTTIRTITLGVVTDIPVAGDYDGDEIADAAVYHPTTGVWTIATSGTGYTASLSFQWGLNGDQPMSGDYDGDHRSDLTVYRPATGVWYIRLSSTGFTTPVSSQWGLNTDTPVPSDYDGDGLTDLAVFRPAIGTWLLQSSATYQWGLPGDIPVPNATVARAITISRRTVAKSMRTADLDGDGRADLNVYRPSNGTWFNLKSSSNYTSSGTFQWGLPGDIPVSSDYDGDGATDLAVWRPSIGTWFIRTSGTSFASSSSFQWGLDGDVPVPGDYDGDGTTDLAVWRPASGTWFIRPSSTGYLTSTSFQWGLGGDVPVPGDYDGDGATDLAVWRPSSGTWFIEPSSTGYATSASFQWGLSGDITVPGDYDGDGRTDLGVWRPSTGTWFILNSSSSSIEIAWGLTGDTPVPADFDGDGKTDLAVHRNASGNWFLLTSGAGFTTSAFVQWGLPGDIPILPRR